MKLEMIEMLEPVAEPGTPTGGGDVDCHYEMIIRATVSNRNLLALVEKATADYVAKHGWGECTVPGLQGYIKHTHGLEVSSIEADYLLRQALGMV